MDLDRILGTCPNSSPLGRVFRQKTIILMDLDRIIILGICSNSWTSHFRSLKGSPLKIDQNILMDLDRILGICLKS